MKKLIPIVLLLASVCQAKDPNGPQGDVKAGIAQAQSMQNIPPTDPGMYVEEAGVFTKIIGQIVGFKRTGSKLVSGVTWHIKSEKVNIQLLGPHAQNIISSRPAFYFIPAKQEADTGVNAGDLVLIRLEEKSKPRQFEIAAQGLFRSSSGVTLTHQIQLLRSEMKTGVYAVAPATALQRGEYALYLSRGEGMAPYVYDFGVEENSSAVVSTATAPKEVQATPAEHLVAQGPQFSGGGWLGVATDLNRSARHDGVPLSEVCTGGPADQAGIQPGDAILSIASHYLYTVDELSAAIKQLEPASRVAVRYQRRAIIVDTYVIVGRQSSAFVSQYPM